VVAKDLFGRAELIDGREGDLEQRAVVDELAELLGWGRAIEDDMKIDVGRDGKVGALEAGQLAALSRNPPARAILSLTDDHGFVSIIARLSGYSCHAVRMWC